MKFSIKFIALLISIGLLFSVTSQTLVVFASKNPTITAQISVPTPIPTFLEATPTVDPASIGDTSGVIAIGFIVVFIILAGVIWGSIELRQGSRKNSQSEE